MKIRYFFPGFILLVILLNGTGFCQTSVNIIPKPQLIEIHPGNFILHENTAIVIPDNDSLTNKLAVFLGDALKQSTGFDLRTTTNNGQTNNNFIEFKLTGHPEADSEEYTLEVKNNSVVIKATHRNGLFYGIQSLLQLLPPENFGRSPAVNTVWNIPCLLIKDKPRFMYRGMHLDVSRHFFPKEFIKKYLDLMAMYKMNYFQWHLTDDNGWRIEIKKYPLLTKVSAWRADRENQPWGKWSPVKKGEKASYGGFYTQDDIKEIVKYAADRFITVIPEIEMPAHTSEVFAAYPQYSCTGETLNVCPGGYWPNKDIFCAGSDSTFTFIENILSEVSTLFPGPYIHIGGDEADKTNWKNCPKCQARIQSEGLKDVEDLQSYFIKRIAVFLDSIGKKMIGWDEIMEGGLAPGATVMCWNDMSKGSEAAASGHDVIMTPTKYCYFDYYQDNPHYDTLGTGGIITLKNVYSFHPLPPGLNEKESGHILGAQANLWTELIKTPERAEYMILPRMLALSEDVWSVPENKNWEDFLARLQLHYKFFDYEGLYYSRGAFEVKINPVYNDEKNEFTISLNSEQPDPHIYYTMNGMDPDTSSTLYKGPFNTGKSVTIKASLMRDNALHFVTEKTVTCGLEIGKKTFYADLPAKRYKGLNDNNTLADGLRGSVYYNDGNWQGFAEKDLDVILDLGNSVPVNQISIGFLQDISAWIFLPKSINISVSADGIKYLSYKSEIDSSELNSDSLYVKSFTEKWNGSAIRFIHIIAKNIGLCPPWHVGAGEPAWLFCDEILVE